MTDYIERDEAIKTIRAALRCRSGKSWSVRGDRGTAWGWITISSPPARCEDGYMTPEETAELSALLGVEVHPHGVSIAAAGDYYREYIDRAEGRPPTVIGEPYWD